MVGPIVAGAVKIGAEIAKRTLAAEGAILGKAWWGFKARREIVAGIRTGLGLGAGIGSFINDGTNPFVEDGKIPPGYRPKINKQLQGNNRQYSARRRRRSYKYCPPRYRRR